MIVIYLLIFFAFLVAIYLMVLIKSFGFMSINELKRRAKLDSRQAQRVLVARLHGLKLWLVLWVLLALMIITVITLINIYPPFPGFLPRILINVFNIGFLVSLLFILPWVKWPRPTLTPASHVGPLLAWLLDKIQFIFKLFKKLKLYEKISVDSPLYIHSTENLIDVMKSLESQTSNPKTLSDLNLAMSALTFNSCSIRNLMIPIADVKKVKANQSLTPKFIDDLHSYGFPTFPVQHTDNKTLIGILYLRDVQIIKQTSLLVHQVMQAGVHYVLVNMTLRQVMEAFLITKQSIFLVVNSREKIVGLITINDILKQYLGSSGTKNKFKDYDNLEAVAQLTVKRSSDLKQDHKSDDKSKLSSRLKE